MVSLCGNLACREPSQFIVSRKIVVPIGKEDVNKARVSKSIVGAYCPKCTEIVKQDYEIEDVVIVPITHNN